MMALQWLAGYLGLALVFVWGSAQREGFNFCFSGVFYYYWQSVHFGRGTGHWGVIIWGLVNFLILVPDIS